MHGKVKHVGRNEKHFYIYLGAQVVMEYLKLVYGQTCLEQMAKFKRTRDENGGGVRGKLVRTRISF